MSLGTGIFLSALLLSAVILFAVTKDRWSWKRIIKWCLLLPTALTVLSGTGIYLYTEWQDRPAAQTDFYNIPITATPTDVKFLKGEPVAKDGLNRWTYNVGSESDAVQYLIQFKDDQIHFILYSAEGSHQYGPSLLRFNMYSSYQDVQEKLGLPSHTSESNDKLTRISCYDKLNVFFSFQKGQVVAYGIYQPKFGPINLK